MNISISIGKYEYIWYQLTISYIHILSVELIYATEYEKKKGWIANE